MPVYRVLYLKEQAAVDRFRSQPPPEGAATIKPKDYEQVGELEAPNEYAAWQALQGDAAAERGWRSMGVGDVLEVEGAKPRVCRFVGFDDASWRVFEPRKKGSTEDAPASEEGNTTETPA
jgi:hypothetical protein